MQSPFKKIRSIYIVYWFLLTYIIAALVWWFIALMHQNETMIQIKKAELDNNAPQYPQQIAKLNEEQQRKTAQYMGEGAVFFLLIIAGAIFVFRAVRNRLRESQQQQGFMMAVTHELKTPIAVTKLNLETLLKRKLDPTQQERLLQTSLEETNRLNSLCTNLLFSSQMEAGRYQFSSEIFNASNVLHEIITEFRQRYPDRFIESKIEKDFKINGDPTLFKIAVSNLVENAIKYAPRPLPILMYITEAGKMVKINIADQGPGVEEAEREKIFEKFYRTGNAATKTAKGTGLGLYLVQKIIDAHHGEVQVLANSPTGSIFVITVPQVN